MPPRHRGFQEANFKPKNFKGTLKRLIMHFRPELAAFIFVIIVIIISSVLSVTSPIFLQNIINGFANDLNNIRLDPTYIGSYISMNEAGVLVVNWTQMQLSFGIIIGFYLFSSLIHWLSQFIVVKISAQYAFDMRQEVKAKLDLLPLSYFDSHTVGELLSRGTNDVDNISANMSMIINQTIYGIALFIGVVITMFIVSWELALVVIAVLPIDVLITFLIAKNSQKQYIAYQNRLGEVEGHAEEQYAGFTVVKLFNKENDSLKRFNILSDHMKKADWKSHWLSSLIFPAMRFVNNIGYVAVSVIGAIIVDNSANPVGQIGTIVIFFIYLQMFQQPFQQIGEIAATIQLVIASADRIYELLDEVEEPKEDIDAINDESLIKGKVSFENVDFSYKKDKELITNMNLKVSEGDSIAIVGPTGAGKTTIVNLLMRFYDVDNGAIILDGSDVKHYTRKTLRGAYGMVLQDTWLFNGSIKENIRYGRSDASDQDVINAAEAAHAHHFISTLPGGYDFVLHEDGSNISQGQRQLLTIARAIVSQPKILILDEATSSVDTRTEMMIQDVMNKMMVGRTSFIIAHRLSTIKNAKTIIVMNKGHIIESGNHKELLAKGGFYADLYNAQFSGSNPMAKLETTSDSTT
ncbi:MAG: ABC transporter ATP-binding protein/permease [Erysipelotrichaceae bacterium]|jgi:ATP-binding cassette subfamily B protein|nr:ABC transporter ATP-binding protein/permease [Erysipelotrichaceae bacterium]